MKQGFTTLATHEFFEDPLRARAAALEAMALDGWEGIALDAPRAVATDRYVTLPMVLGRRIGLGADAGLNLRRDTLLAVTHLERNFTHVAFAFDWKEIARPARPVAAVAPVGEPGGFVSSFTPMDLRSRVPDLPWEPATLSITALLGDRSANRVRVKLGGALPEDPAVTAFVARNRAVAYPRPVWPPRVEGGVFPLYEPPAAPGVGALGIAGSFDAGTVSAAGARCVFRGRFRLPVMDREIVRERDRYDDELSAPRGAGWVDVGDPRASAVVPITLVFVSEERAGPTVVRLQVPSATEVAPDEAGKPVEGCFAVDLAAIGGMPRDPGRHRLWAFSGEFQAGPWVLSVTA